MKGAPQQTSVKSMTMRSLPTESVEEKSSALFSEHLTSPHSSESVGRLQMANDYEHTPALLDEITELFTDLPAGAVVDATLGGGGHAKRLLASRTELRLLGVDRDPSARAAAAHVLSEFDARVRIVGGTFGDLTQILHENADFLSGGGVAGVLLDLGVSSPQLDDPRRGFSFRSDAPLDMRMDPSRGITAAELVGNLDVAQLARLLHRHGESRFAGAIARSIKQSSPSTTGELVDAVERAVPMAARRRGHVATRVFQALRVEVNDEEGELERGLEMAFDALAPGGILAVISYHSGEDRAVKSFLHQLATGGCVCPPALGCVCGAQRTLRLMKSSAVMARAEEVERNPRARSARLRAGWKLAP